MADYISQYTGGQIDSAVGRALPGGTLETLIAEKVPGALGSFYRSGGAVGWYRIAESTNFGASAILRVTHAWSSGGPSDLVCLANGGHGGLQCLHSRGYGDRAPIISNVRVIQTASGSVCIDVYCREAVYNTWTISLINTWKPNEGTGFGFVVQTPTFVATDDTLPDGETLVNPMEWLNPPMQLGVEYRTTERYLGKPVYAKVVDMGTLPNAALLEVNHGISNLGYIVLLNGTMRYGENNFYIPHSSGSPAYEDFCGIGPSTVWVVTTKDRTNYSAKILIKYTKTTD